MRLILYVLAGAIAAPLVMFGIFRLLDFISDATTPFVTLVGLLAFFGGVIGLAFHRIREREAGRCE